MASALRLDPVTRYGLFTPSLAFFATLCLTLLPAELFTVLAGGLYLLYVLQSHRAANVLALKLFAPFALMAGYAALLGGGNDLYDFGKDAWYALKLCLCLGLGCLIGFSETDSGAGMRALSRFAVLTAIWVILHFILVGDAPPVAGIGDNSLRLPLVALGIVPILLEQVRRERTGRIVYPLAQLGLLLIAVLASDSRITILAAAAMVIAWAGLLANPRKAVVGVILTTVVVVLIWQLLPEYTGGPLTVAVKLRRSLDEVLLTDGFDPTQMLLNWRGFEAYNAQMMFDNATLARKLFGNGLGATVDLGVAVDLGGDQPFRYLPILHNGFYNILVKYGVLGVVIYTLAVARLAFSGFAAAGRGLLEDRILRGMVIVILLSTLVITGLYNKGALHGVALLTAWLVGLLTRYRLAMQDAQDVSIAPRPR